MSQDSREFLRQIVRVLDTSVHAECSQRSHVVRSVAGQKDTADTEKLRQLRGGGPRQHALELTRVSIERRAPGLCAPSRSARCR